jgi:hypothetical protein
MKRGFGDNLMTFFSSVCQNNKKISSKICRVERWLYGWHQEEFGQVFDRPFFLVVRPNLKTLNTLGLRVWNLVAGYLKNSSLSRENHPCIEMYTNFTGSLKNQ